MEKIRNLIVGKTFELPLVVASATARETKAKKPFLQLELFDGHDTIQGMYWDWTSGIIPDKNMIVDVTGQVTEYNGTKQLNIKTMRANQTLRISEFAPNSGIDVEQIYKDAYECTMNVQDTFLRSLTIAVLDALKVRWLEVPGAIKVHHAFVGGTLLHSLTVGRLACAMSKLIPESNDDLCFVGGLLHDIGKLYTYKMNGVSIEMTNEGNLYEHVFMGAEFIGNFAEDKPWYNETTDYYKLAIIRHIILSHHGNLEYGSPVLPACLEAHIVSHADGVDASVQQVIEQSKKLGDVMWTDRVYTLGNRPQLTTQFVRDVFFEEECAECKLPVRNN